MEPWHESINRLEIYKNMKITKIKLQFTVDVIDS